MPTRLRKIRKYRGSRTCGWGQIGQHRKGGAKGGRGIGKKAGHKHKYTWVLENAPNHFGKEGFKPPIKKPIKKIINLKDLENIIKKIELSKEAKYINGLLLVNLIEYGYDKLLGSGNISKPVVIVSNEWSKKSEEKINKIGGKIIKPSQLNM
jgi:large subunit ribosomal protein L15